MSVYYRLVLNSVCRSNHHRLAVMALQHLEDVNAERWRKLFLHHQASYLEGAKAPDTTFKDFKNHVLHVRDGDWGGAPAAAREWYRRTVRALKQEDWKHAAYCAGVMSHYVCDPVQPFHTGQTEEEGVIHRAVEWSFSKAFPELYLILEQDLGYPKVELADGDYWLEDMVREGAATSNQHYETVIDHYDFKIGKKHPEQGPDQELKDVIAGLLGYATMLLSRVLDAAFDEAAVEPPKTNLVLDTLFAAANVPIRKLLKALEDEQERDLVEDQYEEFKRTGKVRETLSEDDKVVRALHAEEVLGVSLASLDCEWPRETGTAHGQGAPARKTRKLKNKTIVRAKAKMPVAEVIVEEAPVEAFEEEAGVDQSVEDLMALADEPEPETEAEIEAEFEEADEDETEDNALVVVDEDDEESTELEVASDDYDDEDEEEAEASDNIDHDYAAAIEEIEPEDADEDEDAVTASVFAAPLEIDARAERDAEADAIRASEGVESSHEQRRARIRLRREDDVVDAPSIGPKTASRLYVIGVKTVSDLLELAPQDAAKQIKASHINAQVIRDWQSQALLACTVPGISGTTSQLLVGAGVYSPEDLMDADPEFLLEAVCEYAETKEGERLLRGKEPPELDQVEEWIEGARSVLENRDAA